MYFRFLSLAALLLLLPSALRASDAVELIAAGRPVCVIVSNADPGGKPGIYGERPLVQVVADFQRILEKMTGAKIPIVAPAQVPADGVKIYIGDTSPVQLDDAQLDPRGYWIVVQPGAVILRGKTEGATINAIYGFLQEKLDVRWFFPSELFEVVPHRDTLALAPCRELHNPVLKGGIFMVDSGVNKDGQVWCERMRRDAYAFQYQAPGVHYLGYIMDSARYGKTHPEFYPLIGGKRLIPPPGDRSGPQLCISNPQLVQDVIDYCRGEFQRDPRALMVAIGENDNPDWCECDQCRAMDVLPIEKVDGMEQHSDRYFTFANQVSRAIAQSNPGKLLGALAYDGTVSPPRHIARLEPNLVIGLCRDDSQYYDPAYEAKDTAILDGWKKKTDIFSTYDYLSLGWIIPRYYPHLFARTIKGLHDKGMLSMYSEVQPDWSTFGPMIYLAAQMMWDPTQDPDVILDDFFTRLFGPKAGPEMKAYYGVFETAWMRPNPRRQGKYFEGFSYLREQMLPYTLDDLSQALAHLEKAKDLAVDPDEKRRVDYIAHEFSYSALLMRGWLSSDQVDAELASLDSPEKAQHLRALLHTVADAMQNEEHVYSTTLLIDPISDKGYYKSGHTDHFGILRGQWLPRCTYSLNLGAAALVKYYRAHKEDAQLATLSHDLPAATVQSATQAAAEKLGDECLGDGNMEKPYFANLWRAQNSHLSLSDDAHGGKKSLKIEAVGARGNAIQAFSVKGGAKYAFDFWYKTTPQSSLYYYVSIMGHSQNVAGESVQGSGWTHLTGTFTTPRGSGAADIGFMVGRDQPVLIDDVSVRPVLDGAQADCKKVDTGFPDWAHPSFTLDTTAHLGLLITPEKWGGPAKFSVAACLGWQSEGLRLAVKVKRSDPYLQRYSGDNMWEGDCIQFGFDTAQTSHFGVDDTHDFIYGLSQPDAANARADMFCWTAPAGAARGVISVGNDHHYSVTRQGNETVYDTLISWHRLGLAPKPGTAFNFDLVAFNSTIQPGGGSSLIWLQLTPGLAGPDGLAPGYWQKFVLTD